MALPRVLSPYSGDGIDVPIMLGSAHRTFDVALLDPVGGIVVAECKRTAAPIKLSDFDSFAFRVELLRRESRQEVAGVYFTKTDYQRGAILAAGDCGIQLAICAEGQIPEGFSLTWLRYDPARDKKIRDRLESVSEKLEMMDEIQVVRIPRDT